MSDVSRKLSITEALALIRLNFETCYRIPQVCRQNSVFVSNSNNLRYFDDIKSELFGIFKRCQEAKCKIFDINDKCVEAISSNKNNNWLIRNIVYFILKKKNNKATINSKAAFQYYIKQEKMWR